MDSSFETYQKRLQDELSQVEQELESHSQQVETLNRRLEGLKRALELCDSEQSAVAELLRTGVPGLEFTATKPMRLAAPSQKSAPSRKVVPTRRQPPVVMRAAQRSGKSGMAAVRATSNGGMKRLDMIVAALKRHPRLTVRELIAALEREFAWKCGESNLTAHLYTNPEIFSHGKADRAGKQLVAWSVR
jgi:hypothetical protein